MPIYEYQCRKCGHDFELMRRVGEMDAPTRCPQCKSRAVRRTLSMFAVRRATEPPAGGGGLDDDGHDHGFDDDDDDF